MIECPAKAGRRHAQCRSGALHQGTDRRYPGTQHQRNADHAFAADETDFQREVSVGQHQQRHECVAREVHVTDFLARLVEHVAELQRHRLEAFDQAPAIIARKCGEQTIFDHEGRSTVALSQDTQPSAEPAHRMYVSEHTFIVNIGRLTHTLQPCRRPVVPVLRRDQNRRVRT